MPHARGHARAPRSKIRSSGSPCGRVASTPRLLAVASPRAPCVRGSRVDEVADEAVEQERGAMPMGERHTVVHVLNGVHHTAAERRAKSGGTQHARKGRAASVEGPAAHPMGFRGPTTRTMTTETQQHATAKSAQGQSLVSDVGSVSLGVRPSATAASSVSRAVGPCELRAPRHPRAGPDLDRPSARG